MKLILSGVNIRVEALLLCVGKWTMFLLECLLCRM